MSADRLREEVQAWRQRALQAEEEKRKVARAATGTTWKLRKALAKAEARIRQLETEARDGDEAAG